MSRWVCITVHTRSDRHLGPNSDPCGKFDPFPPLLRDPPRILPHRRPTSFPPKFATPPLTRFRRAVLLISPWIQVCSGHTAHPLHLHEPSTALTFVMGAALHVLYFLL
jgi:hypothetical protein